MRFCESSVKNKTNQRGFSLIDLLLVIVIVALLSTIAIPSLMNASQADEAADAVTTLRKMSMTQASYHHREGRFARLSELNEFSGNKLGTTKGWYMETGGYQYLLFPNSTDILETEYTILAVKFENNKPVSAYLVREDGIIEQLI